MLLAVHSEQLIRKSRLEDGVTQAELARRLGTTQSAIARLETPGGNPRLATLERALEALGRRLEISAPRSDVDVAQIDSQLALTPAERLRRHDAASRNLRSLLGSARRADVVR